MTWRTKLRPASFRGVRFFVDDTSTTTGRKIQLHEYPKRDLPFGEDMGKVSKVYNIRAFVVGPDCFDQRDALLDALEQEGSGTLVHPTLGTINVKAGACRFADARTQGGLVRFDLVFYPGDEIDSPSSSVNSAQSIFSSGKSFIATAQERFLTAIGDINVAGINVRVLGQSLADVYTVAAEEISGFSDLVGDVASFASIAINSPALLPGMLLDSVADAYGFSGAVTSMSQSVGSIRSSINALSNLNEKPSFESYGTTMSRLNAVSSGLTETKAKAVGGDDTTKLVAAVANLVQDSLTLKGAGEAALVTVATKPVAPAKTPDIDQQAQEPIVREDVPVAEDVMESRDTLCEAIWEASMNAEAEHFVSMNELRQCIFKHLSEVAQAGVNLISVDLTEVTPSLVIAWRQWHDATRASEVVQRNAVIHPGFVSNETVLLAQQ